MKLKHLESALSNVEGFRQPVWSLEQYITPPALAASFNLTVASLDDIEGCSILDLGCGTGMLLIGAMIMGAECAVGVDADLDALLLAKENITHNMELDEEAIDLIQADVIQPLPFKSGRCKEILKLSEKDASLDVVVVKGLRTDLMNGLHVTDQFDTVIMNPPFGTKNQGVDLAFVKQGLHYASTVYSLHKSSTREFLTGKGAAACGASQAEVVATMSFVLPATYKFHKQKNVDIQVDLIRFTKAEDEEG